MHPNSSSFSYFSRCRLQMLPTFCIFIFLEMTHEPHFTEELTYFYAKLIEKALFVDAGLDESE